ncbi:MAG: hypothetical protein GKR95_14200 [Gammaproteobacteria bacterium]|nr:hypothetical protein [Gammaproteobacteria bacterium]
MTNVLLNVNKDFVSSDWEGSPNGNWCYSMSAPEQISNKKAWKIAFSGTDTDWATVCWAIKPGGTAPVVPGNAAKLKFWAIGMAGGEKVQFGFPNGPKQKFTLTKQWAHYSISLSNYTANQTNPFMWACGSGLNDNKTITFGLGASSDAIQYIKS